MVLQVDEFHCDPDAKRKDVLGNDLADIPSDEKDRPLLRRLRSCEI